MAIFGINVDLNINNYSNGRPLEERLVDGIVKENDERDIFLAFLGKKFGGSVTVFESILEESRQSAIDLLDEVEIDVDDLKNFVVEELKVVNDGGLSLYDTVVRKIIENLNPKFTSVHRNLDRGKFDGEVPFGYPGIHKKAVGLFEAKIKDSIIKETKVQFLERKNVESSLRVLSREMFFAMNRLGLTGEKLISYLKIVFAIESLSVAPTINERDFEVILGNSLLNDDAVNLVHVKCLRFVYPKEGGVRVLRDTHDAVIDGVKGSYSPKSEANLFPRLLSLKQILEENGVSTSFTIVYADEDLGLLFPVNNQFVSNACLKEARSDVDVYVKHLKGLFSKSFNFVGINDLAVQVGEGYKAFRREIERNIQNFEGHYVNPDFFERDRVDHQYEYYRQLLGEKYTRDEARRSITAQTASCIALEKLLPVVGENVVLVEENRGGENQLIANGKYPVVFMRLRDEGKISDD